MSNDLKLKFTGVENPDPKFNQSLVDDEFQIVKSYQLVSDRAESRSFTESVDDNMLIQLTTEDGLEWIGYGDDLPDILGIAESHRSGEPIAISEYLHYQDRDRNIFKKIKNKVIDFIKPKAVGEAAKVTVHKIAKRLDRSIAREEGVFKVDRNGSIGKIKTKIADNSRALLFIHGTISDFESGFGGMDEVEYSEMYDHYNGQVYAYIHHTLTRSPIENVNDLLNDMGKNIIIDIISHSRGGIVADVLARCDYRNEFIGFTEDEMDVIEKEMDGLELSDLLIDKDKSEMDHMKAINKKASKRKITVNKIVRVACPASGTILLSTRIDHFLNALLYLIGLHVGGKGNIIYDQFKNFLLHMVAAKADVEVLPGLWSMVPDSAFQKINNNDFALAGDLISITGDSNLSGNVIHSLKVILTNLFYWEANDFVVHTASMNNGLTTRNSNHFIPVPDDEIDHFKYFRKRENLEIVAKALLDSRSLSLQSAETRSRGVVLDLFDMGNLTPKEPLGDKPIVVLLPGIMGSNIYHHNDKIWMDFSEIMKGGISKYLNSDDNISAKSAIAKYYEGLADHLSQANIDVALFPYDWRNSLSKAAVQFNAKMNEWMAHGQRISIIAHSMGGLVVRQWMHDFKKSWNSFMAKDQSRFIMLGTPWQGSHLIVEVLLGHSSRVKQLSTLDLKNNRRELLEVFNKYLGVFELLPTNDRRIHAKKNWDDYREMVGKHKMAPISNDALKHFNQFSNTFSNYPLKESDRERIYYVAGKADETINGFKIVNRFFFRKKKIKYTSTQDGDGSVTWSSGIPSNILQSNLYYTTVEHGNLACEGELFNGILDLVKEGETRNPAFKDKPVRRTARSGQRQAPLIQRSDYLDYFNLEKAMDRIMGIEEEATVEEVKTAPLQVEIFNGDLKWSNYPVMIGHFQGDGVVSAEDALDKYLNGKLTERHRMGFYPGRIGEQAIMYDKHDIPTGAVIIGLGSKDDLTGYRMARSVEKAMLKYALFFRDNFPDNEYRDVRTSVSTLMIGSAYGRLPREESIRSIILGVQNANKILLGFDDETTDLPPIQTIEIVDYYEDNAYECYKILKRLEKEENHLKIKVTNDIEKGYGRRKRFLRDQSRSWWQSFTTEVVEEKDDQGRKSRHLAFTTYNGLSSASKDDVRSDLQLAMYLADELSTSDVWDKESSKVIFELLLPNQYKDFVRNHRNIQWRMDTFSAQFPWEMFHDSNYGEKPTFIESGLIRQLYNEEATLRPALVTAKRALVIGDPIFDQSFLPQLPGAKAEAESVIVKLKANGFTVEEKIAKNPLEITKALFAREYRVLHIASHGLYDLKDNRIGIAIGGDQLLTPGTIKQLTAIPEFVFINCCYSGKVDDRMEHYVRHRHKLAANVGTQLIDIGVKAVVIAGWKVNDHSAKVFAEHLYDALLDGAHFGNAVTRARRACYLDNKRNNTWGAYQCYGDQFYKLSPYERSSSDRNEQTLDIEIVLELDNIISKSESVEISKEEEKVGTKIYNKTQELVERAESLGPLSSEIIEKEAIIYHLLGRYEAAIEKFEELFRIGEGKYLYTYIDTYYNIKSKFLARLYDKRGTKEGCPFSMKDILDAYNSHVSIRDYAESLSSYGSTLKRAALLADSKPECRKHLEDSADKYLKAGKMIGIESKNSIYHFTSFITLATLCNLGLKVPRIDINKELGMDRDVYLYQWIKKLQHRRVDRTDIWLQLSEMQLKMTSLLTSPSDSTEAHQAMCKELILMYHKQIEKTMNIKVLVGEYEHMLFLKHIMYRFADMKERMECIKEIKDFIAKYLPGL